MNYFKFLFYFALLLLIIQQASGQNQSEGISFDSTKNFYVVKYYCNEEGNLVKGTYIPGNLVEPKVDARVEFISSDGSYEYSYKIKNEDSALRLLYSFSVKKYARTKRVKNPSSTWVNYFMPDTTISWRQSRTRIKGIKPGSKEPGFSFQSSGLPSIVSAFASSNTFTGFPDEGPTDSKIQKELDSLEQATQYVNLKTIGPRKLPEDIGNSAMLDTLQSYLNFSCDTTWIENQGICRSLEVKLENVDRQLERGNANTAANNLQAFLNEVEALKEKQISSEAYALLHYNGTYLKEKLESRQ